ncbi:hypothetical protein [Trujillonella humicola]|uniref:hypothetical protein n=1 Tax=Trujillonella humicola TaxID=3383699 RepID=UPI0039059358
MTTTLTARPDAPPAVVPDAAPARPAGRPATAPPAAALCPIELRALRSGARLLADALTGIALDDPCDRDRQRAVREVARLVLGGVHAAAGRLADGDVDAAAVRVRAALATFGHDVSAGAPALAMACTALADRLDALAASGAGHEHGWRASPLVCERRVRAAAGLPARSVVPWFLDAARADERMALVRDGSSRLRLALRSGEERHRRTVALVRG